jgi:hypothetical protein
VYGNWKRLIKGLFIRKHLQTKYNLGVDQDKDEEMLVVVAKVPMILLIRSDRINSYD